MTTKISKKDSLLHIFTREGKTFTFHNVKILADNESALVFEYGALSDNRVKTGCFYKSNLAGHSVTS